MFIAVLIAGGSVISGSVIAGPLEDGIAAAERGDYAAALRLWRPLAEEGDAQAQFNLGKMCHDGLGVAQDYKEAVKWYRLSAEQGLAPAQNSIGFSPFYSPEGA